MPFPPKTKETHFDYEALVKSNVSLGILALLDMGLTSPANYAAAVGSFVKRGH